MPRPRLVVSESSKNAPVLILDREGSIGLALYAKLKGFLPVVLAGGREPAHAENLSFFHLNNHIPQIPEEEYSHIFLIADSEKDFADFLPGCIEKAEKDKSKLIIVMHREQVQVEVINDILERNKNTIFVILGDVFGNPFIRATHNRIDMLFHLAKTKGILHLDDMGLEKLYPVEFGDGINELLKIAFNTKMSTNMFFLFPTFPVTTLGLSRTIKKLDPLLRIDFPHEKHHEIPPPAGPEMPPHGEHVLSNTYPVFEKLSQAYTHSENKEKETTKKEEPFQPPKKTSEKNEKSDFWEEPKKRMPKKSVFLLCIIFLLTLFFLPFVVTLLLGFFSSQSLVAAKNALEKGDIKTSKEYAQTGQELLDLSQKTLPVLSWEAGFLQQQSIVNRISENLHAGQMLADTMTKAIYAVQTFKNIAQGYTINPKNDFYNGLNALKSLLVTGETLSTNPYLPASLKSVLGNTFSETNFAFNIMDSLPSVFGIEKKKTYLVLFQNNMELRPGGGFIGSYGLLTVDKGKIVDFTIHDVYEADGQLKGHVEPPFAIRRYLSQPHFYLRDSNFDVDFVKNAQEAVFLLQLETGQYVDGVIGVDLDFVKSMISALKSVYVSEYNETVTPDNFFPLTEKHAEQNFFPGSSQKKDFLVSLFTAIKQKLAVDTLNYGSILQQTIQAIKQKHILFEFADSNIQNLFTINGLSSSLWDERLQQGNTINDFVGINEANLGINKVNYFIDRTIDQHVVVSDSGDISEQVTVTYQNTSSDQQWTSGTYKNYLRFILPQNASLVKVLIDGQEQPVIPAVTDFSLYEKKGFIPPSGLEVEKTEEQGKTLYGFLINIPAKTKKTITMVYVLPQKIDMSQPTGQYSLDVFKQPGTDIYPYSLSFDLPSGFALLKSTPQLQEQNGEVSLFLQQSTDEKIQMVFTKK